MVAYLIRIILENAADIVNVTKNLFLCDQYLDFSWLQEVKALCKTHGCFTSSRFRIYFHDERNSNILAWILTKFILPRGGAFLPLLLVTAVDVFLHHALLLPGNRHI